MAKETAPLGLPLTTGTWTTTTATDGTDLAILSLGSGPGLVVVHGSMQSAAAHLELARLLADQHTVHLMERRGRGRSGPYPPDATLRTEVDDLARVLAETESPAAIGISSGALLVGRAATTVPSLRRAVLFEPPLVVDGSISLGFVDRFESELAAGDLDAAMVTAMRGAQMGPPFLRAVPGFVLRAMSRRQLARDAAAALAPSRDRIRLDDLVRALPQDFRIVTESADRIAAFAAIDPARVRVQVLAGTKTRPYLRLAAEAMGQAVPGAELVSLPGTNHGATQNRDQWGRPDIVASAVKSFLRRPARR